jgi:hypothetical protein
MPASGEQSVTTVALSVKHVLDKFSASLPRLQFVYDEALSYETAITKYRNKTALDSTTEPPFPLLAIKRSVLRWPEEGMGRRSVTHRALTYGIDSSIVHKFIFAEFDLEFLYLHNQTFETEVFEINYLSELGISNDHEIVMDLPQVGTFKNYCHFSGLLDKQFENVDNFYQALTGMVTIKGVFLTLDARASGAKVIKEIDTVIKDLNTHNIYSEFKIN